jgi:hypothetical protein
MSPVAQKKGISTNRNLTMFRIVMAYTPSQQTAPQAARISSAGA